MQYILLRLVMYAYINIIWSQLLFDHHYYLIIIVLQNKGKHGVPVLPINSS